MEANVTSASQNLNNEDSAGQLSQQQQSLTSQYQQSQPHHRRRHHEERHQFYLRALFIFCYALVKIMIFILIPATRVIQLAYFCLIYDEECH